MLKKFNRLLALAAALFLGLDVQAQMPEGANRTSPPTTGGDQGAIVERATRRRTLQDARAAAAVRTKAALKAKGFKVDPKSLGTNPSTTPIPKVVGALAGAANGPQAGLAVGPQVDSPGFKLQQPDYMFGTASNWHNTKPLRKFLDPLPGIISTTDPTSTGLKHGIPVAIPNRQKYADSDYYEIDVVDYTQQPHSELNPTRLRGYQNHNAASEGQVKTGAVNYLGPIIIAKKDRPVRVKMFNYLPTGGVDANGRRPGDLFIPVDKTLSGAGLGPLSATETFTENREEFHLHGGLSPWISDGTPHQWITPAKETTLYPKGYVFQNVPDMSAVNEAGAATYFWSNQQSGRLMFYHDHAFGLTRLNVYAGTAAGYLIVDPTETRLINAGIIPSPGSKLPISDDPWDMKPFNATTHPVNPPLVDEVAGLQNVYTYGIPLVIQDKTFVDTSTMNIDMANPRGSRGVVGMTQIEPDTANPGNLLRDKALIDPVNNPNGYVLKKFDAITGAYIPYTGATNTVWLAGVGLPATDPTWDVDAYGGDGSLWFPHVYMPNQNPADLSGANAMGRWDYGAWFWPPLVPTSAGGTLVHGEVPIPNDPNGTTIPGTPNPSLTPEAFMDTPVVNGMAYPTLTVNPIAYRFRILSAGNDRVLNLSWFKADSTGLEVPMVPSAPNAAWPAYWPTDGRDGGVPDPAAAGPSWIQIGNEAGFIPNPTVIPPAPVQYNYNRRDIVVLNIANHSLLLGPAERADVIVDFSAFAGQTLILYNDSPAPVPAFDARLDYYAGDPDQQASGGAPTTMPGYGPNTRTIMQVKVAAGTPGAPYDVNALNAAWASTATSKGAYEEAQHIPVVPQVAYNKALNRNVTKDTWARIQDYSFFPNAANPGFIATENGAQVNPMFHNAAIQELWELDYGRMNATLGIEIPKTTNNIQTTIPLGYVDPTTENLQDGTSGFWKITHNGVDTHPVHFHLFEVQVVNRVGWDGAVRFPDPNELGWKETLRMNPLEDIVVAFRPISPRMPAAMTGSTGTALLNSSRPPDVLVKIGDPITVADLTNFPATNANIGNPITIPNKETSYGWEYVWHCHILGHEENDFMRPLVLNVATTLPAAPTLLAAIPADPLAVPPVVGNPQPSLTVVSPGRIDLTWNDNSTDETGFLVKRSPWDTTATGLDTINWATAPTIASLVPNQNRYTDFTLPAGTAAAYCFIAFNQWGESAPSAPVTVGGAVAVEVSGVITKADLKTPIAGVLVTLSNGGGTATTDSTGAYVTHVNSGWSGTVAAALGGWSFTPNPAALGPLTGATVQDFIGVPTATITGNVTTNKGVLLPGVSITASSVASASTTDAAGAYTLNFAGIPWTGTVTAALANYLIAPTPSGSLSLLLPGDHLVQNFTATQVVTISGQVLGIQPTESVDVTFTNADFTTGASSVTVAAPGGVYSLMVPAPYTGTVTPSSSLTGVFFSSASRSYTNQAADLTNQNFQAQVNIAGVVNFTGLPGGAFPLPGVVLTATGGATATTDGFGAYTLTLNRLSTPTVTPVLTGYVFGPVSRSVASALLNSSTTMNFSYSGGIEVSGQVYSNTLPITPIPGVTMTFSNGGGLGVNTTTTTDANGFYIQYVPRGWTGTVTPDPAKGVFNPLTRNFTNVTTIQSGRNFVAAASVTLSGTVLSGTTPLVGVRITLSNGGGAVTTGAGGTYTITLNSGWTGTITPTLRGRIFSPVSILTQVVVNTVVNFNTYQTITGQARIRVAGQNVGLAGVTITYTGSGASAGVSGTQITTATGNFTLQVPTGWTGNVTAADPTLVPSHTWTPAGPTGFNYTTTPVVTNITGLRFNGI